MSCLYDLARIPISRRCNGYYLRWYYNGWHYWLFAPGKVIESTSGEKYRTLGIQKLTIGSTQLTEPQTEAIRTIMNTREVYIYTDYGWGAVRVEPGSWEVYNNMTHGYDIEITIVIGSRHISSTGFSPAIIIPVVPSVITQCEVDIAIAGQIWMCQNYDVNYPGSRVYNDDEDNRVNFKGLYTWDQVTTPGFCPAGWHVPTLAEWNTLLTACGGGFVAGGELKEAGMTHWNLPNTGAVDTYGFAMRSTGEYSGGSYSNLGEYAFVWTADAGGVGTGKFIQFSHTNVQAVQSVVATGTFLGVRLIKDYYCPACVALAATNLGNSNFTANWTAVTGATGYYLDVSTDPAYGSFVSGYHGLFVGNVLTYDVTGLTPGVTYYYRMRTQTVFCTSIYSNSIIQATPGALLLTARGDGLGVGYLRITTTAGVTLSLTGTGRFYSDTLGTLNESITWSPAAGVNTRYIRVPTGTSYLMFSDITKLTALGNTSSIGSGNPAWVWNTALSMANIPNLDISNWNFPNCIDVYVSYGTIVTYNGSIAAFSASLINIYLNTAGTVSGRVSDISPVCTIFGISSTSIMTGDLADIPATMVQFQIFSSPLITGDIADVPNSVTHFGLWQAAPHGDIANLPPNLDTLYLYGNTTLTGDIADLPATSRFIHITGINTISGDIADLGATLDNIYIEGNNTITGSLVDFPINCRSFRIGGANTILGDFSAIPANLYYLSIAGSNTVNGVLADLPATLQQLTISGLNTVSGDVNDLSNSVYLLELLGSNTVTGIISNLPTSLARLIIVGLNTISGDIGGLPIGCTWFSLTGNNVVSDYSGKAWASAGGYYILSVTTGVGGLSSAEVDQLLIDLNGSAYSSPTLRTITITGTNAAPTAASAAARASLVAKGVTVTTN